MKIPNSINKLTLKQFIQLTEIEQSELSDFEKGEQILSLVSGLSLHEINNLPIWKVNNYFKQIAVLRASKPNLNVKKWLFVKGKLYRLTKDEFHLNTNQFTAADTFNADTINNFNKLAAVIYERYKLFGKSEFTDESFRELSEYFSNCKVGRIYGAVFFYSVKFKTLKVSLGQSSLKQNQKIVQHIREIALDKTMDGTPSSMALQAEMLLKRMN